ncbi:hypothetical protein PFISCL1PPCAC_13101, partial [Pristionchus fissidentatus]
VPIFVSSIHGMLLFFAIFAMNFVHIFRDGSFIVPFFGPLVPFLPRWICHVIVQISIVLTTLIWSLIPSTATLQFIALTRLVPVFISPLIVSYVMSSEYTVFYQATTPQFLPTAEFNEMMESIVRDLYKVDQSEPIVLVGSTVSHTELNDNRSMVTILMFVVVIPYSTSYAYFLIMAYHIRRRISFSGASISERTMKMQRAFFVMQLLHSFLPFAILSIPVVVVSIGVLLRYNLDFVTLLSTFSLDFCPIVQVR